MRSRVTLLDDAIAYRRRGFSVIPIKARDKKPLIAWEAYQNNPPAEAMINHWFESWPNANLGLVTGAVSDCVVVDLDSDEARLKLKAQLATSDLSAVPRSRTGKGWQLFFKHPDLTIPNRAGVIPGLDVRGDGGYVVAPPSIHPNGKQYKWEVPLNGNLPTLPEELLKLISTPTAETGNGYRERFNTAGALRGVPEGQRDQTLFKLACKLRSADVPRDMAEALILEAAKNCEPPFSERMALDKVARVYQRYEVKQSLRQDKQFEAWPELLSAKQILSLPPDTTRWAWDLTLPFGTGSAGVAKPKTGKTYTFANLGLAVARGVPFLGRNTTQCPVAYLSLDASLPEIAEIFIRLGLRDCDPVFLHAGAAPKDAIGWVTQRIKENGVRFVVVDTLQRLFRFQNLNDYSEVTNALEPMLEAIREQNAHCLFVHHAKKDAGDDLDSAIGSTAIRGLAYTYLHLKRLPNSERRILRSDQRGGKNIPEVAIGFDRLSGWLRIEGTMEEAEVDEAVPQIREVLEAEDGSLTEKEIRKNVPLRGVIVSKAIKQMFTGNELERSGRGKKGDPFRYSLAPLLNGHSPNSCPEEGVIGGETTGHESRKTAQIVNNIKEHSCPENSDTHGTRTDTNQKRELPGHESANAWEEVSRDEP